MSVAAVVVTTGASDYEVFIIEASCVPPAPVNE